MIAQIDTNKTVSILRSDECPACMGAFDKDNIPQLGVIFVLPEYIEEARQFTEELIAKYGKNKHA